MTEKVSMKRFVRLLGAVAVAAGCASYDPFAPVVVTGSQSAVSGCESVGEVRAEGKQTREEVTVELGEQARRKNANAVLVTEADPQRGTAYRCASPPLAATR